MTARDDRTAGVAVREVYPGWWAGIQYPVSSIRGQAVSEINLILVLVLDPNLTLVLTLDSDSGS